MIRKLRVFIASSQESRHIAEIISEKLNEHFDVYPWYDESIFKLSKTPIESLEYLKSKFEAMIVISNYEDKLIKRGNEYSAIRDNLIFEYALGIGYFGRDNSVLLVPENIENTTGPTDLTGMNHLVYNLAAERYNSIDKVSEKLIRHLFECNIIQYPNTGPNGSNLLSKEVEFIVAGNYSFHAIIPNSKRLSIKIRQTQSASIGFSTSSIIGLILDTDVSDNCTVITNNPLVGKDVDARVIVSGIGEITIEYYEGDSLIDKKLIKVQ